MNKPGSFEKLRGIVAKLRDPNGGCPWDLEQTHASLKQYVIEEAHELIDAIDNDPSEIKQELGDVLLQVMLHSQIAQDEKRFTIEDVMETLSDKLVKRHPHVFGEVKVKDSAEVLKNWEAIKKEGSAERKSMLDGLPKAMPGLLAAHRIGQKVSRVGFDWDNGAEVTKKIEEELQEFLSAACKKQDKSLLEDEFGDLLFTLAQLARKLDLNAEDALRKANDKFMRRFKEMERSGRELKDLTFEELHELWDRAKESCRVRK